MAMDVDIDFSEAVLFFEGYKISVLNWNNFNYSFEDIGYIFKELTVLLQKK